MFHRFHRRAPSNPTSPLPGSEQLGPWEGAAIHEHPQTVQDIFPRPDARPRSSHTTNTPPFLPPIPRVTSDEPDRTFDLGKPEHHATPARPLYTPNESSFIGGVALQNYRRGVMDQNRPHSSGDALRSMPQSQPQTHLLQRSKPPPPPIKTDLNPSSRPPLVPTKPATTLAIPTHAQNGQSDTGKRPAGTRLASEPAALAAAQLAQDIQKPKYGFLKNPVMNLLGRKKAGQHGLDEISPGYTGREEPVYAPIRGTRVHDFSAPRPPQPRRAPPSATGRVEEKLPEAYPEPPRAQNAFIEPERSNFEPQAHERIAKQPSDLSLQERVRQSLDQKPLPEVTMPPVPPKDNTVASSRTTSTKSRSVSLAGSAMLASTPSTASRASRNVSMSDRSIRDGTMTALPKHMKSNSSRFSFMIGSANQEKLLEERHRQKQMEKKTTDTYKNPHRDSRFDDLEEDGFDYDAMMDDDGLEEPIPGVNADLEDEDYDNFGDPDNDQENFAGFVFQRSNQASTLPTPISSGMMPTPRDAHGRVIGFAMSKDSTTPELHQVMEDSPVYLDDPASQPKDDSTVSGLGIHGLQLNAPTDTGSEAFDDNVSPPPIPDRSRLRGDDLYFDQGLADELDFESPQDGIPFDESIFDINDTDQYGRPIPGAFAQAKAARDAAVQEAAKRESDVTSRHSKQSQLSQSTAHTSVSVGVHRVASDANKSTASDLISPKQELPVSRQPISEEEQVAAYQAALAQAAHIAAATGKFRRDSSPPAATGLQQGEPETASPPLHESLDDYEDDPYAQDLGDYELDDDEFIAEANASALANDMDGFYGQEFGFYSAPAGSHHSNSSSLSKAGSAQLNAQNLYEYSSGGYFGPSGVGRSASGRVVSREPNLTPITERSEYSNRNSIMSLGLPPMGSGELRSPGLAQLAMMADDGDMTLSALMRLRNKAFGGSRVSLDSSRDGSPQSAAGERDGAASPWTPQSSFLAPRDNGHVRKNSATAFSLRSRDSDAGSGNASPTLTMSLPAPVASTSPVPPPLFSPQTGLQPQPNPGPVASGCPPVFEDEEVTSNAVITGSGIMAGSGSWMKSPQPDPNQASMPSQQRRPGMGHRHKGSADSISYTMEKGDDRETRWVMERRRTADTGEVEILGRQVVDGGRI
jgi:hypothetical protein